MPIRLTLETRLAAVVALAAAVPYLPTLDYYFVQDDFGVVGLLSQKPAGYFPRWFVSTWMDDIWGSTPDEIRPFPAVTYQIAALWDAGSPVANHAINILFHVANSLLVFAVARTAAGLGLGASAVAGVLFAVLPMHAESVAWVTGRVDSMPACFYLAAFLLYVRWRNGGGMSAYAWSLAAAFVALFTKQNTLTLLPALLLYDVIVRRVPVRGLWLAVPFYSPYAVLTAGYLLLRRAVFGEFAREAMLTAARVEHFLLDLAVHLKRMTLGELGVALPALAVLLPVAAVTALVALAGRRTAGPSAPGRARSALYFGIVWIALGAAPTLVATYASPRHMYLAAVGWAIVLAIGADVLWGSRPARVHRPGAALAIGALLMLYLVQLGLDLRHWHRRAEVSRGAVADIEREASDSPPGTLILAGAPRGSWAFALPHALRPPFTATDLTRRVSVISHSALYCCPTPQWEAYTRGALRAWIDDPQRPPAVALAWDERTGERARLHESDDPVLRAVMAVLADTDSPAALDRAIIDTLEQLVSRRGTTGRRQR